MRIRPFVPAIGMLTILMACWAAARQTPIAANQIAAGQTPAATNLHPATLLQLMRGVMFPNSNVIFLSQSKRFANVTPAKDPSAATDPLQGTYAGWEAVENSSLAIVEETNLLTVSGRVCSNGRPVPVNNPDWPKLVDGLRTAGMQSFHAAQTKDPAKMADAADALTTACGNCHVKYRDKDKMDDRCR